MEEQAFSLPFNSISRVLRVCVAQHGKHSAAIQVGSRARVAPMAVAAEEKSRSAVARDSISAGTPVSSTAAAWALISRAASKPHFLR